MKYCLVFLLVLFLPSLSIAQNVTFSWDYPHQVSDLAGFKLYQEGVEFADIPDPAAREWTGEIDLKDDVNIFTGTAYDQAGGESVHSEPLEYNPPPPAMGTMNITVNITIEFQQKPEE